MLSLSLSLSSQRSNHGRLWGLWGCKFSRLQWIHLSIWKRRWIHSLIWKRRKRQRQIWSQYPSKNKSKIWSQYRLDPTLIVLKQLLLPSTPYVHPCPYLPPCPWTSWPDQILPRSEMDPWDTGMCYIVWVSVSLFFFMRRFSIKSACFLVLWIGTKCIFSQWTVVVRVLQRN